MTTAVKEETIIFYGKNFTPLSKDCYGCYHFGTICEGSVYRTECPTGQVEDIRPSIVASLLLRATDNRFTLARVFGYGIANVVKKEDLEGNEDLLQEYKEAVNTPEDVIENYKKMYSLDLYAEQEVYEPEFVQQPPSDSNKELREDPFKDADAIDITDEELPF